MVDPNQGFDIQIYADLSDADIGSLMQKCRGQA